MTDYFRNPRMSSDELRKAIKNLKKQNLFQADIDTLKKLLAPLMHHYVHPAPLVQPGERVFRAVKWTTKPTNLKHLSYPPADKVALGRCNRAGQPVFYGSVGSIAAIRETMPEYGQRLVVSMWRIRKPVLVICVGYNERAFKKLGSERWNQVWWQKDKVGEEIPPGAYTKENMLIDRFLADEFTKIIRQIQSWKYKLSIAIAETYLYAKPASNVAGPIAGLIKAGETITGMECGGLIYPSIATQANDDNIVLKSAVADDALTFSWAHYIEIIPPTNQGDDFSIHGIDYAEQVTQTGDIQWMNGFPGDISPGSDLRLHVVGNELVLKDSLGTIVGSMGKLDPISPKA